LCAWDLFCVTQGYNSTEFLWGWEHPQAHVASLGGVAPNAGPTSSPTQRSHQECTVSILGTSHGGGHRYSSGTTGIAKQSKQRKDTHVLGSFLQAQVCGPCVAVQGHIGVRPRTGVHAGGGLVAQPQGLPEVQVKQGVPRGQGAAIGPVLLKPKGVRGACVCGGWWFGKGWGGGGGRDSALSGTVDNGRATIRATHP
jgi:hypothetical protein